MHNVENDASEHNSSALFYIKDIKTGTVSSELSSVNNRIKTERGVYGLQRNTVIS